MFLPIDPHLGAIHEGCRAAMAILENFAETDAIVEVKGIILTQQQIVDDLIRQRHYGDRMLAEFTEYCQSRCKEFDEIGDF